MAIMYGISAQEKNQLVNGEISNVWNFNPVQDVNGNWFISIEEINAGDHAQFPFLGSLQPFDATFPVVLDRG